MKSNKLIYKKNNLYYLVILEPDKIYNKDIIRKIAYKFLTTGIYKQFETDMIEIVESFIAMSDIRIKKSIIKKDSWVLTIKKRGKKHE